MTRDPLPLPSDAAVAPRPHPVVTGLALGRPHLLVPAWAAALSGAANLAAPRLELSSLAAGAGWSLMLAGGHVLNLWRDRQGDRINRKNRFWSGRIAAGRLPAIAIALAAAGFALAAGRRGALLPALASAFLIAAYHLPPLDLARRWGWGLAAHIVGYAAVAPWLGQALVGTPSLGPWLQVAALLVGPVAAAFLWSTLMDRDGDRAVGKDTWAVRWGTRATVRSAAVAAALTVPLGWSWISGAAQRSYGRPATAGAALATDAATVAILAFALAAFVVAALVPVLSPTRFSRRIPGRARNAKPDPAPEATRQSIRIPARDATRNPVPGSDSRSRWRLLVMLAVGIAAMPGALRWPGAAACLAGAALLALALMARVQGE